MSFSFSKYRFLNKGLVCARDPILAIVRTALFWRTINGFSVLVLVHAHIRLQYDKYGRTRVL